MLSWGLIVDDQLLIHRTNATLIKKSKTNDPGLRVAPLALVSTPPA